MRISVISREHDAWNKEEKKILFSTNEMNNIQLFNI